VAGSFTGNGSGLTNLTGANIVTGIPATVLPSSVAYLSVNQLWTAPQTYGSSVTITSPNGQLVSFNLTAGSMTVNNLNASQFVKTDAAKNLVSGTLATSDIPGGATSYIQNTASLQAGATAYPSYVYVGSSETVQGSGGLGVTDGAVLGAATVMNLTNNQFVKTNGSNQLVSTTIQPSDIPGGATSYIQLTNTLQAGSTFYVSSGTVNNLNIQSTLQLAGLAGTSGYLLASQGPGAAPQWVASPASTLLTSTNTWSATQMYVSSVTFSSAVVTGNGAGTSGYLLASQGPGAAPQWVASPASTLLTSTNTWSAGQTFVSCVAFSSAVVTGNGAGTSGYLLASQGPGAAPQWVASPASTLLTSTNTWSSGQTFISSVTFSSAVVTGNGAGTSGYLLASQGPGAAPQWVASPASTLLT